MTVPCPWLTAPQAAAALGISLSTLYRWRSQQLLVAGRDWRRKFPHGNSPVLYHLERVEQRMATLAASSGSSIEPSLDERRPLPSRSRR